MPILPSDKPNPISTPMLSGPSSSTALLPISAAQQLSCMRLNLKPKPKFCDNYTPNRNNGYASLADGEISNGHTHASSMRNRVVDKPCASNGNGNFLPLARE